MICSGTWGCTAQGSRQCQAREANFCSSSRHLGDSRSTLAPWAQLSTQLGPGGQSAFLVSGVGNAAVLRVSAFERNPLGLKEPDIAFH